MSKIVVSGETLHNVVRESASMIADTVGSTAGPKGKTVAVSKPYGAPEVTKDGYKVMKSLKPENPGQATVVAFMSQSCFKCNDLVGDGTTSCCLASTACAIEAVKAKNAGYNPVSIKNGMTLALDLAIKEVASMSRAVSSQSEIAQVAKISANGDGEVGNSIAECVEKVGKEGVITIEESKGYKTLEVERTHGMQFDRGYLSHHFITDSEKSVCEYETCFVLVVDKKLAAVQPLIPILESVSRLNKAILIVAEDVEGESLTTLALNSFRATLKVVAVKAPGFGERRKEIMQDIAILTGTYKVDDELFKLEDMKIEDLGTAKSIKVTKDSTTIVADQDAMNYKGDKKRRDDVAARIAVINRQIADSNSDYDKEKLRERLAKLSGGVAVLRVGGSTEIEEKERKDRAEDALHATRAAIEEGIVAGGGAALLYASKKLDSLNKNLGEDERIGVSIVKRAMQAPIRKIVSNAGIDPAIVVDHLLAQKDHELIFNVETMEYSNAFTSGVIDPAKVVRISFETAVSVAAMLVGTDSLVVDSPASKDESAGGAAGAGGGMGGMGGMGGF